MNKLSISIALAVTLVACGSGDGASDTTSAAETTSTTAPVAETTTTAPETTTTGAPTTTATAANTTTSSDAGEETTTSTDPDPGAPEGADETITPEGFWEVRIGETVAANEDRIGGPFDDLGGDPTACVVLQLPEVGGVYFIAGTLTGEPVDDPGQLVLGRVSADAPGWATEHGIEVGTSVDQAESILGDSITERSPHAYVDGGEYLVVGPEDARYVFETDGDAITAVHAGTEPIVSYVEACS